MTHASALSKTTRTDRNVHLPCTVDVCIPVFRSDPTALVRQLAEQDGAVRTALRIYDDGSGDAALTRMMETALADYPGPSTLIEAKRNRGRAVARNALLAAAESDWLLLLDSDMRIDGTMFLSAYRKAADEQGDPCCIVGGFAIDRHGVTASTRLHAMQSLASECLPARRRAADPARYVFTSNIFLHRAIPEAVRFDDRFKGWGWEDVDWGLRISRQFPVLHIDNQALHLGLDTASDLIGKYAESGPNFLRMLENHPDAVARMPVYRWARRLAGFPGRGMVTATARAFALAEVMPARLRLVALKLYRAGLYGEVLHDSDR